MYTLWFFWLEGGYIVFQNHNHLTVSNKKSNANIIWWLFWCYIHVLLKTKHGIVHMHNGLKRRKKVYILMRKYTKSNQCLVIFFRRGQQSEKKLPKKLINLVIVNRHLKTLFFHFKFIIHAVISYALKIVSWKSHFCTKFSPQNFHV